MRKLIEPSIPCRLLENARLLGERVIESQKAADLSRRRLHEANIEFRTMDRDINTIRPELMKLQWEKEQYPTMQNNQL